MERSLQDRYNDLEDAYFELSKKYQSEVGEPTRILLQAGRWMDRFDWRGVTQPPELVEVLALVNAAVKKVSPQKQPDL